MMPPRRHGIGFHRSRKGMPARTLSKKSCLAVLALSPLDKYGPLDKSRGAAFLGIGPVSAVSRLLGRWQWPGVAKLVQHFQFSSTLSRKSIFEFQLRR